ncbi:BrnT family toxin [Salmonella enterica subsp. diarizonae]|uniref:BrnT family toxin n=2 Tax=Salmonella enterica TaxID=28901 RepID=A0A744FHS6_SALER|nr:BrnT family toxin [Salmonella enterica]EBX7470057.1 BrnT family toxin [Salmonella enterica subsp. enterica serovar Bareilly]ECA3795334.1 BrnT family toxin [Salmonella enterica subsp. enterica serovar Aqua]ECP8567921.1 BrnT family toxin [Salmonella enterica subsp. enterica serovar Java]ECT3984272.1 BrnT family toxin [Salmonella enterica subsp. houtenae serovar 53:z4,z23:-]ECZ0255927.1 BrnT family toxin [Salmonella enterica subsp. diarizonae]EDV9618252.1 BrnT family toxin [Salmonella enteric
MDAETVFEWDEVKAASNYRKHGIRFEEAARVFDDPFHLSIQDRYENGEYRWQSIGMVRGCMMVVVAHTTRFEDGTEIIRLISARRAERRELRRYEHGQI